MFGAKAHITIYMEILWILYKKMILINDLYNHNILKLNL